MLARIYQPAPSAMQSGRARRRRWVLEFAHTKTRTLDPLTGTYRSTDPGAQLDLGFDTLDEAVSYAKANGIAHRVEKPKTVKRISRSYAENFNYDRKVPWTH
ncbi:MAG: ETC complex I subunit [Hyphomonadaceae bacterium]|nr:ETC complex I subunit [Hyphomonadaceae bacterium]MBC6411853.1 ETC complex I subunit [Hyphomonadaceae bacterium]